MEEEGRTRRIVGRDEGRLGWVRRSEREGEIGNHGEQDENEWFNVT